MQDCCVLHAPPRPARHTRRCRSGRDGRARVCGARVAYRGAGGTKIPDEVLVTGSPAKVRGPIAGTGAQMWVDTNPGAYQDLARRYVEGLRPIT